MSRICLRFRQSIGSNAPQKGDGSLRNPYLNHVLMGIILDERLKGEDGSSMDQIVSPD
jgi:hypothetical protein